MLNRFLKMGVAVICTVAIGGCLLFNSTPTNIMAGDRDIEEPSTIQIAPVNQVSWNDDFSVAFTMNHSHEECMGYHMWVEEATRGETGNTQYKAWHPADEDVTFFTGEADGVYRVAVVPIDNKQTYLAEPTYSEWKEFKRPDKSVPTPYNLGWDGVKGTWESEEDDCIGGYIAEIQHKNELGEPWEKLVQLGPYRDFPSDIRAFSDMTYYKEWMKDGYYRFRVKYTSNYVDIETDGQEFSEWSDVLYVQDGKAVFGFETSFDPGDVDGMLEEMDFKAMIEEVDCQFLRTSDGKQYWYEDGVRQGTYDDIAGVMGDGTIRGREIYDRQTDGWYWLDSCYNGAKAVAKEVWVPYVYQDEKRWINNEAEFAANINESGVMAQLVSDAILNEAGKWVRYDATGKMAKGWYKVEGEEALVYPHQAGNTYYYDPKTGMMAKGWLNIDGVDYYFDEVTGVLR